MNILYVSTYLEQKYFEKIFNEAKEKPIQSIQKFNYLFVNGMCKNSHVKNITVLTSAPINRKISKKLFWKGKNIRKGKITFNYLPFINLKFVKQICLAFFSLFLTISWCIKNMKNDSAVIVDGFFPIVSSIAIVLCKIFNIKTITLYTDLIKVDMHDVSYKKNNLRKIIKFITNSGDNINILLSDAFILLTEQMNEIVNKRSKPFIVMEGLVDSNFKEQKSPSKKKAIMYAGGLYEKYGVKLF